MPTHLSSASTQKLCFHSIFTNFSTDILHSLFSLFILPISEIHTSLDFALYKVSNDLHVAKSNGQFSFSSYMTHQLQWLTWSFCFQDITVLSSLLHHCILPLFLISTYYYLQEFSFCFVFYLCLFSPYTHTLDYLIYLMFLNTIFTMMTECNCMTPSFITITLTSPLKTKLINLTAYVTSLLGYLLYIPQD